jgi:hypothetical protein
LNICIYLYTDKKGAVYGPSECGGCEEPDIKNRNLYYHINKLSYLCVFIHAISYIHMYTDKKGAVYGPSECGGCEEPDIENRDLGLFLLFCIFFLFFP